MTTEPFYNQAAMALADLAVLTPYKYPHSTTNIILAGETSDKKFQGPVDVFLELPYNTKDSNDFRNVVKRLFGVFLPTVNVWRVHLDPVVYGDKMMSQILHALCESGIVIAVTPSVEHSSILSVDLASFPRQSRVWFKTQYEERNDVLAMFRDAAWQAAPKSAWSISMDSLLKADLKKFNELNDRRWFNGITIPEVVGVLPCHFRSHHLSNNGNLQFHTLYNEQRHSVFHIVRPEDSKFVYVKQGFVVPASANAVVWIDALRQVPADLARKTWNRLVTNGFTTTVNNPILSDRLEQDKLVDRAEIQHAKHIYTNSPFVRMPTTTNYALQA